MCYIYYNIMLFSLKKKELIICDDIGEPVEYYAEYNKLDKENIVYYHLYMKFKQVEGISGGSAGKESGCNAGDMGLITGLGRFPWEKKSRNN